MKKVVFSGQTDVGRVRTNNEDNFIVCNIWDDAHVLAVVIDGVGGYEGGEVAAEIARETIYEYLVNNPDGDALELLKKAVIYANNSIYRQRKANHELGSMSCVLTASIVELDSMRVNIAHVGDTRLYQYSAGQMEKLSHDHSLIGYREEIGELTEEEAMCHPQRNIISRDVGSVELGDDDTSHIEVASYPLENKTQLLLCSDGLCDMITSVQMAEVLSKGMPVEEKVVGLIEAALDAGGRDNVTVVVVDIESDEDDSDNEDIVSEEPVLETVSPVGADKKPSCRQCKSWIWIGALVVGIAIILCCLFCSENKVETKRTADTTDVAPADSLSISDSLDQQLSLEGEEADADIHDDVSDENN